MHDFEKELPKGSDPAGKRAKILRELRHQIGVRGIESITMRELAPASGVAVATLYNLFDSKEALIAEAVRETHRIVMDSIIQDDGTPDAFDRLLAYAARAAQFNLSEPVYAKAMVYAYYAASKSEYSFHQDFHEYVGGSLEKLLAEMQTLGKLRKWSLPQIIARQIAESMIGTTAEWTKQVIPDEAFIDTALLGILTLLHVHLEDRLRDETQARIRSISDILASKSQARG
jgi:AcrR family transcriptional regulator